MTKPITSAQAMSHPAVVETINALGEMADELRAEVEALTKERDMLKYEVDAIPAIKAERDALMSAAKLAFDALEDCRDVLYQVAHGNQACSDAEGVGSTLPDVFEALKKAGVQ